MGALLCVRLGCCLVVDADRFSSGLGEQLDLAAAFHADEPPRRFVDGVADGEQTVVSQDHRLGRTERGGDACTFRDVGHHAPVSVVQRVVAVEVAGILRDLVEQTTQ
jgi:hypothetical protein